jgi:hypothetical protein
MHRFAASMPFRAAAKVSLDNKNLRVNGKLIESRIMELAQFGLNENGHGYRVAFTDGDVEVAGND